MTAQDKPNTYIPISGEKRKLFPSARYKQDTPVEGSLNFSNTFDTRYESTFDFRHQFRSYPLMI